MRVAVSQFATSSNSQENLASCIRMINQAATCKPSLIVLPEYCNTQPWYNDHHQAWDEALSIEGPFLKKIAEQAIKHDCYIVINVTLRRDPARTLPSIKQNGLTQQNATANSTINYQSNISVTSCLFSPIGELVNQTDKQVLSTHEKNFFMCATNVAEVITTPFGNFGLLTGSDSITFDASRALALNNAQLLCNSINTYALDQSNLHDPARAFENNVFFATANKIGSYAQQEEFAATGVHTGHSQIISADGKVLAKLDHNEEGFAFADIDLSMTGADTTTASRVQPGLNNKVRPDGTQFFNQLRPELYQTLRVTVKDTELVKIAQQHEHDNKVPVTANVAIFATYKSNEHAIEDVCQYIENNLTDIIQLPELFFIADKTITHDAQQRAEITALSRQLIAQVSVVLRPFQYLCTSLLIDGKHQAVLISEHGLVATQQQLHFCQRYQWTELGNELNIIELPLEQGTISLAMLTADDANIAEIVNIAALRNIHLLLVPFDIQEPGEVEHSLLSRAAENRICIVAASREKNFANDLPTQTATNNIYGKNKIKVQKSTGLIANLTTAPELLPQWRAQKFNGYINQPLVKLQYGKITKAVIHPIAACTKRTLNTR